MYHTVRASVNEPQIWSLHGVKKRYLLEPGFLSIRNFFCERTPYLPYVGD